MKSAVRGVLAAVTMLVVAGQLGGCPFGTSPLEFVAGTTGEATVLRSAALVEVLTPVNDLSIAGGTQVEVNWRAFARTRTSVINVIVDDDQTPDNESAGETVIYSNLPLTQSTALIDTTRLPRGTYNVGILIVEIGDIAAYGYAPGRVTIDQRPDLYFNSPRGSFDYDRTQRINPEFTVEWELSDPDSTNTTQIFLDPDDLANGNEILLYESDSQTGDSFSFNLPSLAFEAGTYRIMALVSDGVNSASFYAPGSVRLRSRLAGPVDLRDLNRGDSPLEGAIFEGFNPRDNAGSFVSGMGDIDADGFGEFIILSQFGKPRYIVNTRRTGVGEAYMIYGRAERFRGVVNLNSTGTLFRGEIFEGVAEQFDPIRPSRGITSFTVLSDWDADGVREMAFGLPFTDSRVVDIAHLDLDVEWTESPMDNDGAFRTGGVVIAAGSALRPSLNFPGGHVFNLAGFGQIPYRPRVAPPPCPETFFGPNAPSYFLGGGVTQTYRHIWNITARSDEQAMLGCRIHTHDFGDQCGESISSYPGDAILIACPNRNPAVNTQLPFDLPGAGVVSLYFASNIWDAGLDPRLPHDGPYRYILDDRRFFEAPPFSIMYRGSPSYYVDADDSDPCLPDWSNFTPVPARTARIYGGFSGASISNAETVGDFNADGLADFVVGSPLSNDGAGSCFIVLGRLRDLIMDGELPLEELGVPMNSPNPASQRVLDGIRVIGKRGERLGQAQKPAGDFNNDGIDDVIIGSPLINNRKGGAAVFFGSRTVINLTEEEIPFDELPARDLGVIFVGEEDGDLAGARVANAGDVDGDGNSDIMIAAPNRSVRLDIDQDGYAEIDRTYCGVVYLVYGSPKLREKRSLQDDGTYTERGVLLLRDIGTESLPGVALIGRDSGDHLGAGLGEQGDRSHGIASAGDIDGDGHGDVLIGSVAASPRDRARAGEAYLLYGVGD